jgi:4-cresol dehydrogenase (hydroxylating)
MADNSSGAHRRPPHIDLVRAAVLAPTPDNNQPWRFVTRGDELLIYLVPEETLPSDVHAMSDLTGLGAAIENISIAALQAGYTACVEYLAPPAIRTAEDACQPVASIRLTAGGDPDPFAPYLAQRCTCRRLYSTRPVAADRLARLSAATDRFADVQIDWITDRPRVRALSRLISTTDLVRFQCETFHNEVFRQLRFSPEEVERTRDGLDWRTLELPPGAGLLLRLLSPWNRMRWVHRLGLGRLLTLPSVLSMRKSGAIGVLSVPEATATNYLRGGQAFQRVWLAATAEGLSLQPIGSPGVFFAHFEQLGGERLSTRQREMVGTAMGRFQELLPQVQGRVVQIAFRVGWSRAPRFRSLRRAAEDALNRSCKDASLAVKEKPSKGSVSPQQGYPMEGNQADGPATGPSASYWPNSSAFLVSPPDRQSLSAAITRWTELLGAEHVLFDAPTLDRYARSTLPVSTRPKAVLRPASTEEVRRVVVIAGEHGTPLYPISRGKNWGYGDACAPTDGQVIVDLSRMNRILEVDAELAYAVVEPGVTQQQMCDYLRQHDYPLWLDVTGAGPDASIVGNTLERGFGHTPYGNRFQQMCGLEVVLADGRVLNTGFGSYEGAQAARVFPAGIGPWLDGLFTQSNLGVVTRMGVWLMPAPPVCQAFALKVRHDRDLEAIVDALRPLRLMDVVRSTVHVANDLRVISARRAYPWDLTGGATPLPDDVRRQLQKDAGIGAWNVMGALYGTREIVAAARKVVRRGLRHLGHVHFFGHTKLKWGLAGARFLGRIGLLKHLEETVQSAASVYELLRGVPSVDHLKGVGWRTRGAPRYRAEDPTNTGSLWLSPALPMTGAACREVLELVQPAFSDYGFEPLITMISVNSRALLAVMTICYEKQDAEESGRAMACYETLFDLLTLRGYLPYRVGIQSMGKVAHPSHVFWDVVNRISRSVNPDGLIAPGRYQPSEPAE